MDARVNKHSSRDVFPGHRGSARVTVGFLSFLGGYLIGYVS